MGNAGLKSAYERGEPLVDVIVSFRTDVDPFATTERINAECDDFDLSPQPFYDQPQSRIGTATHTALGRLFGMQLKRVRLERYDEVTGTWGHWPNAWRWQLVTELNPSCSDVAGMIKDIGLSLPGQYDDGQPWE